MTIKVNETQEHAGVSDESAQVDVEAAHTSTPWQWKHTELWGTHNANGLTMDKCILFATFAAHVDVNTANARLIVEAVNSHASLIAERDALRAVADASRDLIGARMGHQHDEALARLRAALDSGTER